MYLFKITFFFLELISMEITLGKLPEEEWKKYKEIRLEALKNDSIAFGSSYEEEINRPESHWRNRTVGAVFAFSGEKIIGLMSYKDEDRPKTKHKSGIYSVYVKPDYRGKGVGKKLLEETLRLIKLNEEIIKVNLTVNPSQISAVKLYESFGFKAVGTLHKELLVNGTYYDEVLMELLF